MLDEAHSLVRLSSAWKGACERETFYNGKKWNALSSFIALFFDFKCQAYLSLAKLK